MAIEKRVLIMYRRFGVEGCLNESDITELKRYLLSVDKLVIFYLIQIRNDSAMDYQQSGELTAEQRNELRFRCMKFLAACRLKKLIVDLISSCSVVRDIELEAWQSQLREVNDALGKFLDTCKKANAHKRTGWSALLKSKQATEKEAEDARVFKEWIDRLERERRSPPVPQIYLTPVEVETSGTSRDGQRVMAFYRVSDVDD